ncbi:transglutaminase family protein [Pseudoxanthomonas daejeonensis]|uniref:transglutaminase-like domain-containing protein n=1 Tax=Pseudoxanthomonas daejeonensis TaxID=266062 RepID=UPI001F5477FD|nr:transglutaminase family protein [Pseudoxanthomonas daejeonensis]UNK56324.1 transglutaminase family protein [Pseudoxanthomonas daejeonensis]
MLLHLGFEIAYRFVQPTPMVVMLDIHGSRSGDITACEPLSTLPSVPLRKYRDGFGNTCTRLHAPAGLLLLSAAAIVRDSGLPDRQQPDAMQVPVEALPDETLPFLLGSRYCESDTLMQYAWDRFGHVEPGWTRVQAICDHVHAAIQFGYHHADPTRGALRALEEGRGVCRDFAHAAVALCRCMNIPARYCTGYLGDIGVPPVDAPMDFSAWFEVWLDGDWYTFDARHNVPRIGRVLIARGRDAADVAISSTFGPNTLERFDIVTEETTHAALDIARDPVPVDCVA